MQLVKRNDLKDLRINKELFKRDTEEVRVTSAAEHHHHPSSHSLKFKLCFMTSLSQITVDHCLKNKSLPAKRSFSLYVYVLILLLLVEKFFLMTSIMT